MTAASDALFDEHHEWTILQRSVDQPKFLYLTTWAGLANRLIALVSAYTLAVLTRRVLVLDESTFDEPLLEPPVPWEVAQWPQFAQLRAAQEAKIGASGWMTTDTAEWVTIDTERSPFDGPLARLGCANLSEAYPQPVLHVHSIAQYLVPLLLLNPAGATLRRALGHAPIARLAQRVLAPAPAFAAAAAAQPSAALPRPVLGVQLRMHNVWVRKGTPRLRRSAEACASAMVRGLGVAAAHLASDDLAARDGLAESLTRGANVEGGGAEGGGAGAERAGVEGGGGGGGGGALRVGTLAVAPEALKRENMSVGWLELLVLARGDSLLTTGGSSYGYVARALSAAPLRRQRVLTRWEELERRGRPFALDDDCPLLRTREPCLMHAWREDWNLTRLPCFEPSRFPPAVLRHLTDPLHELSQCF